jgi:alanine-synthesizing transaminase
MTMLKTIRKSAKLANVCYDIRGPVLARAKLMEEEGHRIIKLNIGNLAPFGFDTPDEVRHDVIVNLPQASGYSDSKGLFAARKAIMHYTQQKGIAGVGLDDIFVGNGVSELIVMAMQGLLDDDDEVLVPARTIRCGPRPSASRAAGRGTTSATRARDGCPTSRTSPAGSPSAPARS